MQPVQDLTVEDRVSRTQYQYSLEDRRRRRSCTTWAPQLVDKLQTLPELRDVASDQQNGGLRARAGDRPRHRLAAGITPQMIDDTLYDAFGQRQVSTMFTQLNQYHVVLEVKPDFQHEPGRAEGHLRRARRAAAQVPLSAFTHVEPTTTRRWRSTTRGSSRSVTLSFNLAPGVVAGRRGRRDRRGRARDRPAGQHPAPASRARPQAFQASLANEPLLILAALVTVYIVLGVLYESYIHPITILSTLPSAGVGALLALLLCRTDLSVIALIGIILLIGIVKKNAIMMIDFALEAERKEGKPPDEAIYEACLLRFRPIMMTTMAALLGGAAAGARHAAPARSCAGRWASRSSAA